MIIIMIIAGEVFKKAAALGHHKDVVQKRCF